MEGEEGERIEGRREGEKEKGQSAWRGEREEDERRYGMGRGEEE